MTCKTGRPVFYLDHLIFSGMKYSTNPEISTATRTNAAHDFPIMISTVTGTVWWVYATKWSRQRTAERAFTRARHDPVSAIYEKRRAEILDWKHRELRLWFGQAPFDPWDMPGLEYQYLGFLQFALLWRNKSWTVTARGFLWLFCYEHEKGAAPKHRAEKRWTPVAATQTFDDPWGKQSGESVFTKKTLSHESSFYSVCVASRL